VQHLGRADAIDDVNAEVALESLADVGRQCFAGGRRLAPWFGSAGWASMPAKPVGAPKKMVGLTPPTLPSQRAKVASGVGRSAIRIVVAPTLIGNDRPLPRP
jgi:hypothetical protein